MSQKISKLCGYDYLIRIAIIGDSTVGKSSLMENYFDGTITPGILSTIGIDMRTKTITVNDKTVKIQVWDTAGQERFRVITTSYYRSASALLLVYAIDDIISFQHITSWINSVREHCNSNIPIVLIGNKLDLNSKRIVTTEMGKALADELKIPFFEVSAKNSINVIEAFNHLIDIKFQQFNSTPKIKDQSIKLKSSSDYHCVPFSRCT